VYKIVKTGKVNDTGKLTRKGRRNKMEQIDVKQPVNAKQPVQLLDRTGDLHEALNRALQAELTLDAALNDDPDAEHADEARADRQARDEMIRLVRELVPTGDAAIVHAGHLICLSQEVDGLIVVPSERVKYLGYNPPGAAKITEVNDHAAR
jgi:hypothetical protein